MKENVTFHGILEEEYKYNVEKVMAMEKANKVIYAELTNIKCDIPTERWQKWVTEINCDINELDWLDSLTRFNLCTSSTRLRSMGYRFMLRDVLTNDRLIHMGKVNTKLCYICKTSTETVIHLYWDCPHNKRLWERLKLILFTCLDWKIDLNPTIMLMGADIGEDPPPVLFTLLSLLTIRYIHACKCKDTLPTVKGLNKQYLHIQEVETNIAKRKGYKATKKHNRKWHNINFDV